MLGILFRVVLWGCEVRGKGLVVLRGGVGVICGEGWVCVFVGF